MDYNIKRRHQLKYKNGCKDLPTPSYCLQNHTFKSLKSFINVVYFNDNVNFIQQQLLYMYIKVERENAKHRFSVGLNTLFTYKT